MMIKKLAVAVMAMNLCACTAFFNEYREPDFPVVSSYKEASLFTGDVISKDYWKKFKDEKLNAVMEEALKNNFDLKISYVSVQKALLSVDLTHTDRHPTASAQLGSSTKRALDYHDKWHKSSSGSFSLSYQLDLFGKLKAADEAALENYKATAYDYLSMRLTVIQTTAFAYWDYAYRRELYQIGLQDLKDSDVRLELVNNKYHAGAADRLDLDEAKINHLKVLRTLDSRKAEYEKAKSALAVLLGKTPDAEFDVASLDESVLPKFSLDVPSKLLSRRPDLMEDEALLRKSYAKSNEAKMAFFPDIKLSASASSGDSNSLLRFLQNPVGALGAAITFPFLNFNKLSIENEQSLKDVDIATLRFVSDYINAVKEVYDDIENIRYYRNNLKNYKESYELSVNNYERYRVRYASGLVSISDFLNAADTMRNAKANYLEARLYNLRTTLSLMTALGGDNDGTLDEVEVKLSKEGKTN